MQMQVVHCLSAIRATVQHHAVALRKSLLSRDLCSHAQQMPQQRVMSLLRLGKRDNVLPWHDQYVDRRLWVNIGEGITKLILIDRCRRDRSIRDAAK